jgi:type IV secretory pathway VirB6-like protein
MGACHETTAGGYSMNAQYTNLANKADELADRAEQIRTSLEADAAQLRAVKQSLQMRQLAPAPINPLRRLYNRILSGNAKGLAALAIALYVTVVIGAGYVIGMIITLAQAVMR